MPTAALAIVGVLVLSGCTSSASDGAITLSDWTSSIGARWDTFVADVLAPLANTMLAILISWFALAVAARLVTLLPGVRNIRATRRTGRTLRWIGWILVVSTPIVTVLATAFAADGFSAWLAVSIPLALAAVSTLGLGLATRSRLDARVLMPDGAPNSAWSIDALMQVRNVNLDDPRKRVERPSSPDLGEFITIADRSGNGIASAVAWLFQVLFNSAPWLLQVTILDGRSAIASLRRNGQVLDEVELGLEWGDAASDQHRKLLALAAAFTAMTMADRYPDVRGFYRATNWKSVGYLGLARMSVGDERRLYLSRAIEEDPTSLLAEYDRVFSRFEQAGDRVSLEAVMARLEPIVNQAARLCGAPPVFDDVERKVWHTDIARATEPRAMLLRTLMLYTTAARNWAAFVELERADVARAAVEKRRQRIRTASEQLIEELRIETADRTRDPYGVLARMRARAALCYVIFHPDMTGTDAGPVAATAERWLADARDSLEIEIRYSYACYMARRARALESGPDHDRLVREAINGVRYARHVDFYRREATGDPELKLLGHEPRMRDLALAPIRSPWDIDRFAAVRRALARHGILDPAAIAADDGLGEQLTSLGLEPDDFALLVDASWILRAAQSTEEGGLPPIQRLRAARHLIDDGAYSVRSLSATFARQFEDLAQEVAEAVYWVPTTDELEHVERFMVGLMARIHVEPIVVAVAEAPRRPAGAERPLVAPGAPLDRR